MALRVLAGPAMNFLAAATMTRGQPAFGFSRAGWSDGRPHIPYKFRRFGLFNNLVRFDLGAAKTVDFFSIHGHTMPDGMDVKLSSSTDDFAADRTLEATLLAQPRTFYAVLPVPRSRRYWEIEIGRGFTGGGHIIGEGVLGKSLALIQAQRYGAGYGFEYVQMPQTSMTGERQTIALAEHPVRILTMEFLYETRAAFEEARTLVYTASRGALYPLVVVPDDTDPKTCVFGRLASDWSPRMILDHYWTADFRVVESLLPSRLP